LEFGRIIFVNFKFRLVIDSQICSTPGEE